MDPFMRTVHYLFKKQQITITETKLEQFFDNGIDFPRFICILFNTSQIPGIITNPKNELQRKLNNNLSLIYLFQNNQFIARISPDYYTLNDKANLLTLIFTKQCFNINPQEIISKCNLIVRPLSLHYTQKKDLISKDCILSLLNVLTDGKVRNNDETADFDILMTQVFEQANVPLIIDKTSFDVQNQFFFLIQIEIIFETFSDKIDQIIKKPKLTAKSNDQQSEHQVNTKIEQTKSKSEQTKSKSEQTKSKSEQTKSKSEQTKSKSKQTNSNEIKNQTQLTLNENFIDIELEDDDYDSQSDEAQSNTTEFTDEALLKTINAIGTKANLHFDDFSKAVKKDAPYQFIRIFLKNDQEFNSYFTNPLNRTINHVIKFLSTRDPIFSVLLFNFKDEKYIISSSILFYTNFLNCYFLKKTKQELFERCSTIIFSLLQRGDFFYDKYRTNIMNRKNPYEDKSILFEWNTYLTLLFYIKKMNVHFKPTPNKKIDDLFKKKNIPQIIDENFIENCKFREKDALFYQLQFLFSSLDRKKFIFKFHEILLKAIRLLKKVRVPKYDTLVENIKVKNVSLIIQMKRYSAFLSIKNEEKGKKIDNINPLKKRAQNIKNPETFNDRFKPKKVAQKSTSSLQSAELFWNPPDNDNYSIENGILFSNKNRPKGKNNLIKEIENYKANVKISSNSVQQLFSSIPQTTIKSKLFKFFHYNEQSSKWEIDSSSISSFFKNKHFQNNQKVPIILLSNSDENELNALLSKLTINLTPDLDDDHIYVYGLCEKSLALLQYDIKLTEEKMNVKPLFLLLHVPKSKQKIKNIKTVIFKIYYFLSIICDVEIVVLNKEHYEDQIDLIERINYTKSSYKKTANLKKLANSTLMKNQLENDDFDMSSDGDYDDINEDLTEDINHSLNLNKFNDIIEKVDLSCFRKESKYIVLINDESIQGDICEKVETDFVSNILKKFDKTICHLNYINIKDGITYRCFLSSLDKFVSDVSNTFNDVLKNFDLYKITEISNKYINIKSEAEWTQELKTTIEDRFDQYKKSNSELDDFTLLSKLNDELMTVYPSIDTNFYNECNSIINQIEHSLIKEKDKFFISELNQSSNNNMNYLNELINGQIYWSPEKKDSIEISHCNFLRKEFYCIINALYPRKILPNVLNCNRSILEEKIINDRSKIKKIFSNFEKKYEISDEQLVNLSSERKKGTNYSIRETEKVKEIKVVVESGHLTDAIEQDF